MTCKVILYLGLLAYLLEINMRKEHMQYFAIVLGIVLQVPRLFMPFKGYGVDYTAYVNQAG